MPTPVQAQTPVIMGINPSSFPIRTGTQVKLWGTNLWTAADTCDRLIIYTAGMSDTVRYKPGAGAVPSGLTYVGVNGPTRDTLKFILNKNINCSTSSQIKVRNVITCATKAESSAFPITTGKRAEATVANVGGIYCLGDPNITPVELYDNVYFSLIAPTTGNMGAILNSNTGEILVHSGNVGTYTIRVYTDTVGVHATCNHADTITVKILAMSNDSFAYSATSYCPSSATIQLPTQAPGDIGGTYSSIPAGLALNASTGGITPAGSTSGTYQITYTPLDSSCTNPSTETMVITSIVSTEFDYPDGACSGDTSLWPTITSTAPGSFAVFPLGSPVGTLGIDPTTGEITIPNTTYGRFRIRFHDNTNPPCFLTTFDTIDIAKPPVSAFTFTDSTLCSSPGGTFTLTPTVPGGVFSAQAGLSLAGNVINAGTSTPGGPYYVTYVADTIDAVGTYCVDSTSHAFTVYPNLSATLQYPVSAAGVCSNIGVIDPVFTSGPLGGTFDTNPAGLNIDFTTGQIDLSSSASGIYQIVYHLPNGDCPDSAVVDTINLTRYAQFEVQFTANPTAAQLSVCNTDTFAQLTLVNPAGTPSATSSLTIYGNGTGPFPLPTVNGSNQIVIDSLPVGGPYLVLREVQFGACISQDMIYIEVLQTAEADFDYLDDLVCEGGTNPVPFIIGTGGGQFTCPTNPAMDALLDDVTGEIDITNFLVGTYSIQYSTFNVNQTCFETEFDTVQLLGANSANFTYGSVRFCTSDADTLWPTLNDSTANDTFKVTNVSGPGPLVVDPENGIIAIDQSQPGVYRIERAIVNQGSSGGSCSSTFTLEIELLVGDDSTTMSYPDSVYCQSQANPQPIILGDTSGIFLGVQGIQFANTSGGISLQNSVPDVDEYYVIQYRLENNNGCVVTLRDSIKILPLNASNFEYPKTFVCSTSPIMALSQLPNPPNGIFAMVDDDGDTVNYVDPVTGTIDLTGATFTTRERFEVFFFPTDTSCRENVSRVITAFVGPSNAGISPFPDTTVCEGQTVRVEARGADNYWFSFNGGAMPDQNWGGQAANLYQSLNWAQGDFVDVIAYSPSVDTLRDTTAAPPYPPLQNALGGYMIDTAKTCYVMFRTTLNVLPLPTLTLLDSVGVLSSNEQVQIELQTDVNQTSVNWLAVDNGNASFLPGGGLLQPFDVGAVAVVSNTVQLQNVTSPAQATYSFTPIANGCTGETIEIDVNINPDNVAVFVPQVITPGEDDDLNARWIIQLRNGESEDNYHMLVYNRSGGLVYEMQPLHSNWTGDNLPDGVYWWNLINLTEGRSVQKGGLTIRRK